jgi:hypothetical protein
MRKLVETGLLIICLPLLMGAEIYRWVDLDGIVNFTQLKPRGVPAQQIVTSGSSTVSTPAIDPLAGEPQGDQSDGDPRLTPDQQQMLDDLEAAEQVRQDEIAKIKKASCSKSRNLLGRLSRTSRIRVRDNDGSERMMGEDERQQRISDAQRGISENCIS